MPRLLPLSLLLAVAGCVPAESLVNTPLGPAVGAVVAEASEVEAGQNRFPVEVAGRWGYVDRTGAFVIPPRFDEARAFSEGRAAVRLDGVWGLVDPSGALVAAPAWAAIGDVRGGRARVTRLDGREERYGYVDADGALTVAPDLIAAYDYVGGLAPARAVRRDAPLGIAALAPIGRPVPTRWLLVGTDGRVRAAVDADAVASGAEAGGRLLFPFSRVDGLFRAPRWGWVDAGGAEAIAPRFQAVGGFAEGLAPAAEGDRFGFVDATGAFEIAPRFEAAFAFSNGLARVMEAGRWGFICADGTTASEAQWDGALDASEGRAAVRRGDRWGYLDADGDLVLDLVYAFATPFQNGLARVRDAAGPALIDRDGTVVWRGE